MKRLIVSLLALAVWATPIHAASAFFSHNLGDQLFINYAQFHKSTDTQITKPTSKPSIQLPAKKQPYSGWHYSKEEVQTLIIHYSQLYSIASETPLCVARLESGFNQFSANRSSSARGVFQYLSGTWKATDEGKAGYSVFDADANVRAAVKYMAIHKNTRPWVVAPNCPTLKFL